MLAPGLTLRHFIDSELGIPGWFRRFHGALGVSARDIASFHSRREAATPIEVATGSGPRAQGRQDSALVTQPFFGATAMTSPFPYTLGLGCALTLIPLSASADTVRIYVTNSAGDSIHVIDPGHQQGGADLQRVRKRCTAWQFLARMARGSISATKSQSTLDVFDRKSGKRIKQVALSNRPNNISVAKDGRIVVGIARGDGALDIVDPATLTLKKTIPAPRPLAQRLCHARRQVCR